MGQSPASGSWKPGSLDAMGRQRSSSDPPNMHPPVPPIRLISTGGTGPVLCHTELAFILLSDSEQGEKGSSRNFHLCVPGLGPAPVAKMDAMNIQSKSGQGGSRVVPPKSPAG